MCHVYVLSELTFQLAMENTHVSQEGKWVFLTLH